MLQKGFSKILILIIALALIASGILLWQQMQAPAEGGGKPSGEQAEPVKSPEQWETYRNEEYGFEIRYPNEYKIEISGGHSPAANPELLSRISVVAQRPDITTSYVDIQMVDGKQFSGIEDYKTKKYQKEFVLIDRTDVEGVDYQVFRLGNWDFFFVFLENKDYIFNISSPDKEFLTQILSTFRFID